MKHRIAVVGPGALGCLFAAYLTRAGHDVRLLARRLDQAGVLSSKGISVHETDGGRFSVNVTATCDPLALGDCDLALILVKAHDTAVAAAGVAPALSSEGTVLTVQNGLGNWETLQTALPGAIVLAGTTGQGANLLRTGVVHHGGTGETLIGAPPENEPASSRARQFAEILSDAGLPARVAGDTTGLLWGKLLINVGINALTAVLGVRNGRLLEIEAATEVMQAAVDEARAVADALGVKLPYSDPWEQVVRVARLTAANKSSMLQDLEQGRKTEVTQINGAIVIEAERLGIQTPVNDTLTRLVQSLEGRPTEGRRPAH